MDFGEFVALKAFNMDRPLVHALLERFNPITNTFVFLRVELVFTPLAFLTLTRLRSGERSMLRSECRRITTPTYEFFGLPKGEVKFPNQVILSAFRDACMPGKGEVIVTDMFLYTTRYFLWYLLAAVIFSNLPGKTGDIYWYNYLASPKKTADYDWNGAAYFNLITKIRKWRLAPKGENVDGFLNALKFWCYDHVQQFQSMPTSPAEFSIPRIRYWLNEMARFGNKDDRARIRDKD